VSARRDEIVDVLCGSWIGGPEAVADRILELVDRPRGVTATGAVAVLEALVGADPEKAHGLADETLLQLVPADVRAAYERLKEASAWWASA
jgi:hypothetical protein